MANAYLRVSLFVKNCPIDIIGSDSTVMVARLVDGELWYYGLYNTWERAEEVAKELGNGVVFEIDNENSLKTDKVAMLAELKSEIEKIEMGNNVPFGFESVNKFYEGVSASSNVIQQKIDSLEGNK